MSKGQYLSCRPVAQIKNCSNPSWIFSESQLFSFFIALIQTYTILCWCCKIPQTNISYIKIHPSFYWATGPNIQTRLVHSHYGECSRTLLTSDVQKRRLSTHDFVIFRFKFVSWLGVKRSACSWLITVNAGICRTRNKSAGTPFHYRSTLHNYIQHKHDCLLLRHIMPSHIATRVSE